MLDKMFYPMYQYEKDFLSEAKDSGDKPFFVGLEREKSAIKTYSTRVFANGNTERNVNYIERIIKTMLWCFGGYKIYLKGDKDIFDAIVKIYADKGLRSFDKETMEALYLSKMQIIEVDGEFPTDLEIINDDKYSYEGYRIGFDAGGSDRKVTATIDGKVVFSEETVWFPKINSDAEYHIAGIRHSIDMALPHLGGRVDKIGVSTAGIVVDDEIRLSSLFRLVKGNDFVDKVVPIYKNLGKVYNCPVKVANDGDVAALAGAMDLNQGKVLGVAMGTSLAVGYIDNNGKIRGYLNELAFVPVDANRDAAVDEWSGDYGVGVMYMSQDGVIKLMEEAGVTYDKSLSPAEKLKIAQKLVNDGDPIATEIFVRIGEYFGNSIMWYTRFYEIEKVLFLGRVASGRGGDLVFDTAQALLDKEFGGKIKIVLPDEKSRRLGQSYTAAALN